MRRLLALLFLLLPVCLLADGDSPIVAKTRRKLETPITHEAKDQPLQEMLKELGEQADVRFNLKPEVPKHKSFSLNVKEMPLKDALAKLFEGSGLGYIVHKKQNANDRYEGYIDIVQGDQRGEETPKKDSKDGKKPAPSKSAGKDDKKSEGDAERVAGSKLKLAKLLVDDGKKADAIEALEEIVKKYPKTKAAGEAKELLAKLK